MKSLILFSAAIALMSAAGAIAQAASLNESVAGDLSGVPATPTAWTLQAGSNQLTGRAGTSRTLRTVDYDLVAFTVPAGHQLNSVILTSYQNQDAFAIAFAALEAGPAWTDKLGDLIVGEKMMGWSHIDSTATGSDLLLEIQSHASDPPFAVPLPSGVYTLLIQDIDTVFDYSMSLNVTAIPEPCAAAMVLASVAATWLRRRSR